MSYEEINLLLEEAGLPFAYHHFAEGESPEPPFLIFLSPVAEKIHRCHRKESDEQYDNRPKTRRFIIPVLNHHCDFLGNGTRLSRNISGQH